MQTFQELVSSRRTWIDEVLKPWCATAKRIDLILAEQEWLNLAGQAAPELTLWLWAWNRFPELCAEGLQTINETREIVIETCQGSKYSGFPDARESRQGELVLVQVNGAMTAPILIDDILAVQSCE